MPTVVVPDSGVDDTSAANHSLDELLRTAYPSDYFASWANPRLQAEADGVKLGGVDMTADDYNSSLVQDVPERLGAVALTNQYVRNDTGADINLHIDLGVLN